MTQVNGCKGITFDIIHVDTYVKLSTKISTYQNIVNEK